MDADRIERDLLVAAPVERVWEVLTEAKHIAGWFGESAEIDLRPGGELLLTFEGHGTCQAVVERVEPPRAFAFRWAYEAGIAPDPGRSTLVEFTLTEEGDSTRLRVVESGFSALAVPADEQRRRLADNTDGWRIELDELRDYAQQRAG